MKIVPLNAVASQTLSIFLAGQECFINVYQKTSGLFMDLAVGTDQIINGVLCENANRIVRSLYLNFVGDFVFWDSVEGNQDPTYDGLGSRYYLVYLEQSDLFGLG